LTTFTGEFKTRIVLSLKQAGNGRADASWRSGSIICDVAKPCFVSDSKKMQHVHEDNIKMGLKGNDSEAVRLMELAQNLVSGWIMTTAMHPYIP
jgi:hypothetical protein